MASLEAEPNTTRELAKKAFNAASELIDRKDRGPADEREMLAQAAASRCLWREVGGLEQEMIGDWQVAHVLSLLGVGDLALSFATAALAVAETQHWEDWRLASCLEGVARAHAARGDRAARNKYVAACKAHLDTLTDREDRELIESQLRSVPAVR